MSNVTVLEPTAFVIVYERRLLVKPNPHAEMDAKGAHASGWRGFVWTRSFEAADKFESREAAERFAAHWLNPGCEIRPVYPRKQAGGAA